MSRDTDALLTPPGSGVTFGQPQPKVAVPSPLAKEIAREIEERILSDRLREGLLRPSRRQRMLLVGAALLAAGGGALVAWVARRRG